MLTNALHAASMRDHSQRFQRGTDTPHRILLAEDDDEWRDLIALTLRRDGHYVIEASDGGRLLVRMAAAYKRTQDSFDLVISDIRMPVCSGLQVLEALRYAHWPTPVILMTAFGDEATRNRVEKLGAVLFDKPFDLDDLRTAVLNLVPRKSPGK